HATSFSTLVAAQFFTEQQWWVTAAWVWLFCLLTGLVVFRLSIILSAAWAVFAGIAYYFGALTYAEFYFDEYGVAIPNLLYPLAALLLTFLVVAIYRILFEQAEARATRGAMGKYLSPAILDVVMKDPDALRLGGEKRVMTCLFTDIRGFTSIS